jgi:hypothetical protein
LVGSKLSERKPGAGKDKLRKDSPDRDRPNRQVSDAKIPEGRVGLMLDVNA